MAEDEDAVIAASSSRSMERSELEEQIAAEIGVLKGLDLPELRLRWRKLFRSSAPAHLPKYLLFRISAYKIQANAFGDLDRETIRYLDRIAKDYVRRREAGETRSRKKPPPVPPVSSGRSLKVGTILVREHEGVLQRVIVVQDGVPLERGHLQEPLRGRPRHHRHELERPAVLWATGQEGEERVRLADEEARP